MKSQKNDNIFVKIFSSKILISVLSALLVLLIVFLSISMIQIGKYKNLLDEKISLTEKLEEEIGPADILEFYYEDYNNDGKGEAFAVVGSMAQYSDSVFHNASLWFINQEEPYQVEDFIIKGKKIDMLEWEKNKYLYFESIVRDNDVTEPKAYVYGISDGKAKRWSDSGVYDEIQQKGKKIFGFKNGMDENELSFDNSRFPLNRNDKTDTITDEKQPYDIYKFGSYPQTRVTDENLIKHLDERNAPLINYDLRGNNDGAMKYCDVEYNGEKYRGVLFTKYRSTDSESCIENGTIWAEDNSSNSLQDENGYESNITYWFKYEEIEWMYFDEENSIVTSRSVLDAYYFTEYKSTEIIRYTGSTINRWLNDTFFNTAFDESERNIVAESILNIEKEGTLNTKVYLFAEEDRSKLISMSNDFLYVQPTDYAKCMGVEVVEVGDKEFTTWYLRTPGSEASTACYVGANGTFADVPQKSTFSLGVRPVIKLS